MHMYSSMNADKSTQLFLYLQVHACLGEDLTSYAQQVGQG